jgi:hypothetical protein
MNTKPHAAGQWAQQQQVAEEKDETKRAEKPQMEQRIGAEPMEEPKKKHGDKIDPRLVGRTNPTTPEDQGGIGGP